MLYDRMVEQCSDTTGVGMLMVSNGPGTGDYIPPGKVHLIEDWITPVGAEGVGACDS